MRLACLAFVRQIPFSSPLTLLYYTRFGLIGTCRGQVHDGS